MIDLAPLAAAAVAALAPLLGKAAEKGFEKAGEGISDTLLDSLKRRLKHDGAKEALTDFTKTPTDADTQATLRVQLRKALEADPTLVTELQDLLGNASGMTQTQTAKASGGSHIAQIQGSNNNVTRGV